MNITLLPLYNDKAFSYSASIEGTPIYLEFVYNTRTKHYHLTVYLRDNTTVVEGLKLVANTPLFTAQMEYHGLNGYFYLQPIDRKLVDSAETMYNIADFYFLAYSWG